MRTACVMLVAILVQMVTCDFTELSEAELIAHSQVQRLLSALQDDSNMAMKDHEIGATSHFTFTNCGDPKKEVVIPSDVVLKPDPLVLPGNITAGGKLLIKKPFGSPLKLAVEIHVKTFGVWIKAPCVKNIGSCTYADACQLLNKIKKCPPALVKMGLSCKCPFKPGKWTANAASAYIKANIPANLEVKVKATATYKNQLLTCAELDVNIHKK